MRCPNCSAECAENMLECDFCGHALSSQSLPPVPPASPNRATFSASEPTYTPPQSSYSPPPVHSDNPYSANYPSSSRPSNQSYAKGSVPNHLVWAILATLCCCLPGGIVAIVYAAQVDGKLAGGDYEGALSSSNNAKLWSWISFGIGGFFTLIYFIAIFTGAIADSGGY